MLYVGATLRARALGARAGGACNGRSRSGSRRSLLVLFQQVSAGLAGGERDRDPGGELRRDAARAVRGASIPGRMARRSSRTRSSLALMLVLDWLAPAAGRGLEQHAPAPGRAALALVGIAWLLAPRGVPGRYAAPLLCLPMFARAAAGARRRHRVDHVPRRRTGARRGAYGRRTTRCSTTPGPPYGPTPTPATASSSRSCAAKGSRVSTR